MNNESKIVSNNSNDDLKINATIDILSNINNTSEFNTIKLFDGSDYVFKSITVREQKILSKLFINSMQDFIEDYEIILGMIKYLSLNPEFDINKLYDIDRLKIMTKIIASNYNIASKLFNNDIICDKCNTNNSIVIDFNSFLKILENIENEIKTDMSAGKYRLDKVINNKRIILEYAPLKIMRLINVIKFIRNTNVKLENPELEKYVSEVVSLNSNIIDNMFNNITETAEEVNSILNKKEGNYQSKNVNINIDDKIKNKFKSKDSDITNTVTQILLNKINNKLKTLMSIITDNIYLNILLLDNIKIIDNNTNNELISLSLSSINDIQKLFKIIEQLPIDMFEDSFLENLVVLYTKLFNISIQEKCKNCGNEMTIVPPLYLFFI